MLPGVATGTGIVLPAAILSLLLADRDTSLNWALVFQFVILVGFASAGFVSGRRRSDTPMFHGIAAALGCWIILQTFGAIRRLIADEAVSLATYPAVALLAATCGVVGALTADWTRRRARRH